MLVQGWQVLEALGLEGGAYGDVPALLLHLNGYLGDFAVSIKTGHNKAVVIRSFVMIDIT